jgi:hypothetical protein
MRSLSAVGVLVLLWINPVVAQDINKSTLQFAPKDSVTVFQLPQARVAVEKVLGYVNQLELTKFDEVKELLSSTPYQRFYRLINHLEAVYARPWQKLLGDLTDQGITLALVPVSSEKDPQVMGVVQASDADLMKRAFEAVLAVVKEEAQNNETPQAVKQKEHRGVMVHSVGDKFFIAQHQAHLFAATHVSLITHAIEQLKDKNKPSVLEHPRFVIGECPKSSDVMGWGWVDVKHFKSKAESAVEQFKLPANDLIPQLLFGGLFDTIIRSDYAWITLRFDTQGPRLEVTSPMGRAQGQEGAKLLHMHDPAKGGTLPLLNPQGTLYSTSFYWNLADAWKDRYKLFKEGALKDFEEGDKAVKPFLAGNSLSKLFEHLGGRHRFVIAQQRNTGYTIKPKSPLPAFGLVLECSNPDQFEKLVNLPLRGAGLVFSAAVSLKYFDEKLEGTRISGYRFNEVAKNKAYEQAYYFNFSPSFTRVGNYFVLSSTQELCRDLVTELKKEPAKVVYETTDMRQQFSWTALGAALAAERARVATELTLRHGGSPERIDEQLEQLLKLLDKLGSVELNISHSPGFKLEFKAVYAK